MREEPEALDGNDNMDPESPNFDNLSPPVWLVTSVVLDAGIRKVQSLQELRLHKGIWTEAGLGDEELRRALGVFVDDKSIVVTAAVIFIYLFLARDWGD
ncbi:hypothetical protein MRB53_006288 [Persea americana]|uniref:Uncharacterized protein n=1 Tax=Persea americana TaxID=3435 RepID=A0ACC2MGJ1_PERAE|nr:hypothetical protein MRB53_006288 [Persea americana]